MMRTVLVTGANGFVGRCACQALSARGYPVRRAVRTKAGDASSADDVVVIGDIADVADWRPALANVDAILHLAGRAHVMPRSDTAGDPDAAYHRSNVLGTEALARAAARAGVRRLVFASSIKVNGEATSDRPFRETDPPRPQDAYGRSKWEAEQRLHCVAAETGLEVVVVRPPLVYGPVVKGNLAALLRVLDRGIPLPLGSVDNRRSLVGVGNLVEALHACLAHPHAAGETFLVSDGLDLSTPALIRLMAAALDRRAHLVPVPAWLLRLAAHATRSAALARLTGSLEVDNTHLCTTLAWRPPYSVQHEIAAMVAAYRAQTGSKDMPH